MRKQRNPDELCAVIREARKQGRRVVFANGCFDILHGGHVSYLENAREMGDLLIVGINSDRSMREIKGQGRPIYPEQVRVELLDGMECVDYVILFDEPKCDALLRILRPDIHAKGTDYTVETVPERDTNLELGIEVRIAGDPKENASKDIIQIILDRFKK